MPKKGIDCKIYRNTGSWEAPSWSECDLINEAAPNEAWDVFEVLIRRSRAKFGVKTLVDIGFAGTMLNDASDANYAAFLAALQSDDTLDLLIMDGPRTTDGSAGVRGEYQVTSGNQSQNPGDVLYRQIAIVPYPGENIPQFAVVSGGSLSLTDIIPAEDE